MLSIKFFAADFHPKFALWTQQFRRSASNKRRTHVTHTQLLKIIALLQPSGVVAVKFYSQPAHRIENQLTNQSMQFEIEATYQTTQAPFGIRR
jgi:hypothetical protein